MLCPYCNKTETKVTDKRDSEAVTRRRRECLSCGNRFTTYERVEFDLAVVKKDGKREKFDREKIKKGVDKAFEKLPVSAEKTDKLVSDIESKVYKLSKGKEIKSKKIGEIIMRKLKRVNKVAYIRFASVYREFADLDDFKKELRGLK